MKIITHLNDWRTLRETLAVDSIGFVPTMGCLHAGHASLLKRSVKENDITVLSIFVNPTQFNDPKDYQRYPKTVEADLQLAEQLKVDYVLIPEEKALYPEGNAIFFNTVHPVATILEGKFRPGHFNGMLTIVMKLINLVKATQAYFGEKDYQQYLLVKSMVENYFLPTRIIPCPTVREPSGLPYSSRNARLSVTEKKLAEQFARLLHACTETTLATTRLSLINLGMQVDYLEIYQERLFAAVRIGEVRLIDNIPLRGAPC